MKPIAPWQQNPLSLGNRIKFLWVPVLLIGSLMYGIAWYNRSPDMPTGAVIDAKPAREVAKEKTVALVVTAPIQVYKPAVKRKLKLPSAVIADTNTYVVAASKVKADERPHTITTTLNKETGVFNTYDRVDPLPWVAVNTRTELGVYAGLKNTEPAIRLEAKQTVLQIKAVHVGAVANLDVMGSGVDSFVGVGVWGRF